MPQKTTPYFTSQSSEILWPSACPSSSGHQTGRGRQVLGPPGGCTLEESDLVLRVFSAPARVTNTSVSRHLYALKWSVFLTGGQHSTRTHPLVTCHQCCQLSNFVAEFSNFSDYCCELFPRRSRDQETLGYLSSRSYSLLRTRCASLQSSKSNYCSAQ